jgi:hypothetical protein
MALSDILDQLGTFDGKAKVFGDPELSDRWRADLLDPDEGATATPTKKETNPYEGEYQTAREKQSKAREGLMGSIGKDKRETVDDVNPAFRTPDAGAALFGVMLEALGGKGAGVAFLEGMLKGKMKKAERDTQKKQREADSKSQTEGDAIKRAQLALQFADQDENVTRGLSKQWEAQNLAEEKTRQIEGRNMRAQFYGADKPAEADLAARILRENFPEFAPTEQEIQRQIRTLSVPEAKAYNDRMRKFKESNYFQTDKEMSDVMSEFAEDRGSMIARGIPEDLLDPVLDVKSLKQQIAENNKARYDTAAALAQRKFTFDSFDRNRKFLEGKRQFNARMNMSATQHRDRLTAAWARVEIARQNVQIASDRRDISRLSLLVSEQTKEEKMLADIATEHIDYWQKVRNSRISELRKLKWKPEKIAADPVVAQAEQNVGEYFGQLDSIGVKAKSRIVPQDYGTPTADPEFYVNPGSMGGGRPPALTGTLGGDASGPDSPPVVIDPRDIHIGPEPGAATPASRLPGKGKGTGDMRKADVAAVPGKKVDPFKMMMDKASKAAALKAKAKKMIADGYDPDEIRRRYEKATGQKADF